MSFEATLCSRTCGRLAKARSDTCCAHCPAAHTRCCQQREKARRDAIPSEARATSSGQGGPRGRAALDPEPEPPTEGRTPGTGPPRDPVRSTTPQCMGSSPRGREVPLAAEHDSVFTATRETDEVTGHLLQIIDKQWKENVELSAEVERLQIVIRTLKMDFDQK